MSPRHQHAGSGQQQHDHFGRRNPEHEPFLAPRQRQRQLGEADDGHAGQNDDAHKVADVALVEQGQPAPALGNMAQRPIFRGAVPPPRVFTFFKGETPQGLLTLLFLFISNK